MRVMGIDYGDARTGIAVSDLLCSIVGNTTVIHSRNPEKTAEDLKKAVWYLNRYIDRLEEAKGDGQTP